jgi:hypothetical protein
VVELCKEMFQDFSTKISLRKVARNLIQLPLVLMDVLNWATVAKVVVVAQIATLVQLRVVHSITVTLIEH